MFVTQKQTIKIVETKNDPEVLGLWTCFWAELTIFRFDIYNIEKTLENVQ